MLCSRHQLSNSWSDLLPLRMVFLLHSIENLFQELVARHRERCRFLFNRLWGTQVAEKSLPLMWCQGEPQNMNRHVGLVVCRPDFQIIGRSIRYRPSPAPSPIDVVSPSLFCIFELNICYSVIHGILTVWLLKIGAWPCLIIATTWGVSQSVESSLGTCLISAGEVFFVEAHIRW